MDRRTPILALTCVLTLIAPAARAGEPAPEAVPVGTAVVDVTPSYPVRMTGYGSRKTESEGVASPLKVRAIAIGADDAAAVLLTVDNCAVGGFITDEVARRLSARAGIPRERLAVCSTHTHCAPALSSGLDFIFGAPLPADQKGRIDRYTAELIDAMERTALQALAARAPARLSWGRGSVGFAANRRVLKGGKWTGFGVNPAAPTDHTVSVLKVAGPDGKVRAVLIGYACHCTTLGGEFNQICGEWAGYACDELERLHPGATALVNIGCGADSNPEPRGKLEQAKAYGADLAHEAGRLVATDLTPLPGKIAAKFHAIDLPLAPLPDRATLETRAKLPGAPGMFARSLLAQLDRGEALPTWIPSYPVQTWCFGDDLAMVFLGGEVVVDYALRLRRELDPNRLWISAYSNDVPCYIASKRVLAEGGYEADDSMIYYGRPARLAPEVEDLIVGAVRRLLPTGFHAH